MTNIWIQFYEYQFESRYKQISENYSTSKITLNICTHFCTCVLIICIQSNYIIIIKSNTKTHINILILIKLLVCVKIVRSIMFILIWSMKKSWKKIWSKWIKMLLTSHLLVLHYYFRLSSNDFSYCCRQDNL